MVPQVVIPQSFVVRTECEKAANQHGYHHRRHEINGWATYRSTTAQGHISLAAGGAQGPWYLALEHRGVIAVLAREGITAAADIKGPWPAEYRFATLGELYAVLARVYQLACSLPDQPLTTFIEETRDLPQTTEAERLVVQRIGQDIFRDSLMNYAQGCCQLTGISEPELLRASHIVPWSRCADDAQRLDVHNGLLLSALWDAAFDKGLVSFNDDGTPLFIDGLSAEARSALSWTQPLQLTDGQRRNLAWHRAHLFGRED
jgi:hypothetical protein